MTCMFFLYKNSFRSEYFEKNISPEVYTEGNGSMLFFSEILPDYSPPLNSDYDDDSDYSSADQEDQKMSEMKVNFISC